MFNQIIFTLFFLQPQLESPTSFELIKSLLIFPPDNTGDYVKIDLPITSKIVQQHNDFLSTDYPISLSEAISPLETLILSNRGNISFLDIKSSKITFSPL